MNSAVVRSLIVVTLLSLVVGFVFITLGLTAPSSVQTPITVNGGGMAISPTEFLFAFIFVLGVAGIVIDRNRRQHNLYR